MKPDLILAHAPFLGHTGYAAHSREFFTALSRLYNVRVNNVAVDDISYLTKEQHDIIIEQQFQQPQMTVGTPFDWEEGNLLNIVLFTANGSLFHREYDGPKIAYNVWESTRQSDPFFNMMLQWDQFWVASNWQRMVTIEQGYPHERVKVVPEGIDPNIFKYNRHPRKRGDKTFTFFLAARWEHRKSVTEIMQQYAKRFGDNKDVRFILSADNPFPTDGMNSTNERLEALNIDPDKYNIDIRHFMPFDEYLYTLQNCDCYVSCSRAEGWNLPLLEAIACGVPTICSDYGAQLDFAKGISHTVDIADHLQPQNVYGYEPGTCPGTWAEPDYDHLGHQMEYVYNNHFACKHRAKMGSNEVREKFTWDNAAKIAAKHIEEFDEESKDVVLIKPEDEVINITNHFIDGAFIEVTGVSNKEFLFTMIDQDAKELEYEKVLPINNWARSGKQYYVDWLCEVRDKDGTIYEHKYNAKGKRVLISFESSALGDTLAWIPYVELFRVKHNCQVIVSTFWNHILNEAYQQYKFIHPGQTVDDLYALYRIAVENGNKNVNKTDWRTIPLQKVAADILGVSDKEIQPKVNPPQTLQLHGKKYVTISEASTAGCKQWQFPGGWQAVVDHLTDQGYGVMVVSKEQTQLRNVINQTNQPIQTTMRNIAMSEFFIGVSSGASWLAWALEKPVVLISGCTKEWNEFQDCIRVINKDVCHGCMNNAKYEFDKGDWWWCPTGQDMICTKSITPDMVINSIKNMMVLMKVRDG